MSCVEDDMVLGCPDIFTLRERCCGTGHRDIFILRVGDDVALVVATPLLHERGDVAPIGANIIVDDDVALVFTRIIFLSDRISNPG